MLVPDPVVWVGIAGVCVIVYFLVGVYMMRHRHTDVVYNRYVDQATKQGLSPEDALRAVSMHFVLENYMWPKIKWNEWRKVDEI